MKISYILAYLFFFISFIPKTSADSPHTLTLGTSPLLGTLTFIAEKNGYFTEENLTISLKRMQIGKIIMDSLNAGSIEVGTLVDSNIAFIGYQPNTLRVIASLGTRTNDALYYYKDSISSPADLRGKRIGYAPVTTSHIFLARFLKLHGIAWNEISPVSLQAPSIQTALSGKNVLAGSVWEPFGVNIRNELADKVGAFENTLEIYPTVTLLVTTQERIEKKKTELLKLTSALKKALAFAQAHATDAAKMISGDVGIDAEQMPGYLSKFQLAVAPAGSAKPVVTEIGSWISEAIPEFQGKEVPNYTSIFDESILP